MWSRPEDVFFLGWIWVQLQFFDSLNWFQILHLCFCVEIVILIPQIPFWGPLELEPEPSHAAAQVLRPVLRAVRWEEHPDCGNEQRPASRVPYALQVWPQGIHLQAAGFQKGAWEIQPHL